MQQTQILQSINIFSMPELLLLLLLLIMTHLVSTAKKFSFFFPFLLDGPSLIYSFCVGSSIFGIGCNTLQFSVDFWGAIARLLVFGWLPAAERAKRSCI